MDGIGFTEIYFLAVPHVNDLTMWIVIFSKSAGFFPMQLLENMTDVIRKGILEAELQLQKASEEKLLEEVTVYRYLFVHFIQYLFKTGEHLYLMHKNWTT